MPENNSPETTNLFSKGMNKDRVDSFLGEGIYTHARNAVNNSHEGHIGIIGNEPSNLSCITLPYTHIGSIPLEDSRWLIYSTDDIDSEIGIFNPNQCQYTTLVNDRGLNFKRTNLITGQSRRTFDCSEKAYWTDGLNPDRVIDINKIPFESHKELQGTCYIDVLDQPLTLDSEKIRIASLITIPCFILNKAVGSGVLQNGSYQIFGAYAINEIKITDYVAISNVVAVWSHSGIGGAIELTVSNTDDEFDEMEIVVVANVAGQTSAHRLGIYSPRQGKIYIDNISNALTEISLSLLPLRTPAFEKSDSISSVGDYLLRIGIYTKPDFNYQPLANQIRSNWVQKAVPADYYHKGGSDYGYMRDEVYSFFIRWVYNTGEKSASYLIPGRLSGINNDGASDGTMAFWQSTELFPDDQPNIWGSRCGQPITHHKFPDNTICPHFNPGGATINILGIKFTNIQHPVDINGNKILSIVGYEILRGSREGNKSILAKGILTHMKEYNIPGSTSKGLYKNYPYNDLSSVDPYYNSSQPVSTEYCAFHSPETVFNHPYIGGAMTLSVYQEHFGTATGKFEVPFKHPEFKILGRESGTLATVIGVITGVTTTLRALGVGGDIIMTGTEDLPMSQTLIGRIEVPDLSLTAIGTGGNIAGAIVYAAALIAQGLLAIFTGAIEANVTRQKILDVITGFIPTRQYARQYNSHGFYDNYVNRKESYTIQDAGYVKGSIQTFTNRRINNLYRSDYVILNIPGGLSTAFTTGDNSRIIGGFNIDNEFQNTISCKYGALKVSLPSQYGQVDSIRQIPISYCIHPANPIGYTSTSDLYGGDISIGRHTEKNNFPFYNDWLMGEKNDVIYNYKASINTPDLKWWGVDNRKAYEGFFSSIAQFYSLDNSSGGDDSGWFVDPGVFYTSCNGTLDFFVESEVNVGYRDWEDEMAKRFYDPYGFTDLSQLYRSDVMRQGSFYKYDYSLSPSRLFNQFISWGSVLPRSFDPVVSESCYSYYNRRLIYSLPQSLELKKDNWRSFLVNNYKDFPSKVTTVKPIGKTGAIILLAADGPIILPGVDSLQTDSGAKVTIGDSGLFSRDLQSLTNIDPAFHHGSCQNKFSVSSTIAGVVWGSAEQGKIFIYAGGLKIISDEGMKWWFSRYLPFELLKTFPSYSLADNPVVGIGLQSTYDSTNDILYITKKDYKPKGNVSYSNGYFYPTAFNSQITITNPYGVQSHSPAVPVDLCNPTYFEDCSWTISYDVKTGTWISLHDWHPDLIIPTVTHFVTSKKTCSSTQSILWKHNERVDSYCNFYGQDYPFEVEYASSTGDTVTSAKNVEYTLEAYKYSNGGQDKFHVLDFNFDRAIIRNSEQISDLLKLNINSRTNPFQDLQYPIIDLLNNYTEIVYSKEEQKYRFNQFWDIIKDRGEYSSAQNSPLETQSNGYVFQPNPLAINRQRLATERKRFRHRVNHILLRRNVSGDTKMLFHIAHLNIQGSSR